MKRDARELLLRTQTEFIYALMTGTMRLPDPVLATLFGRLHAMVQSRPTQDGDEIVKRLQELEQYFREKSPLSEALRRMLLDARPSQIKSIIRGYLVNYVYDW